MPYTGLSGGAGAAYTLQDILSRRKDEARQAMLDELNRQEVESNIGYRNSMTDLAKAREEREQGTYYQGLAEDLYDPGKDLPENINPKLMKWMQDNGMIDTVHVATKSKMLPPQGPIDPEMTSPVTPETLNPPAPPTPQETIHQIFRGTRAGRKQVEAEAALDAFSTDPNTSDEGRNFARLSRAGVQNIPNAAIAGLHPINIFDEPSGTVKQSNVRVPGYETVTRNYPPQGPVESWGTAPVMNDKGELIIMSNRGQVKAVPIPGGSTNLSRPGTNGAGGRASVKYIGPGDLAAMRQAQTPGQLWAAQSAIIGKYLQTDDAKQMAREILAYPDKDKFSVDQLMGSLEKDSRTMSPQEAEIMRDVLNVVLGRSEATPPNLWESIVGR